MKKPIQEEDDDIDLEEELEKEDEEEEEEEEEKPRQKQPVKAIAEKPINNSEKYTVVEVPTQTQPMVKDNKDKIYDALSLLCKIANDVELIKKNLV